MNPPIFTIISGESDVTDLLGTDPVRFYPFGQAPDETDMPYAVWQTISGGPENHLTGVPNIDRWLIQVDVYAKRGSTARTVAEALRDAIEPEAYIVAWRGESKEGDNIFRYSFDVEFLTER